MKQPKKPERAVRPSSENAILYSFEPDGQRERELKTIALLEAILEQLKDKA